MTAAVRDLHRNYPKTYLTDVDTAAPDIWESNPFITTFGPNDGQVVDLIDENRQYNHKDLKSVWAAGKIPRVRLNYTAINRCNTSPTHFTEAFTEDLERLLKIRIFDRLGTPDIHLSLDETSWMSQVHESVGRDINYWVVVNGGKYDYTAKWWDPHRMQQVVSHMKHINFVQCGENAHFHHQLVGSNVINLIGKTDMRQFIRLIYHSSGVVCPVTLAMHLAAGVPVRYEKCYGRHVRPCVVIAGGREPMRWEAYNNHAYLHMCGRLTCCQGGACWKSRVVKLGDSEEHDRSLCEFPEVTENNTIIPKCLKMITVDDVVRAIQSYIQ